ncbi:hypothetical protein [Dactylosporangium sp. CA-233914]|uniref:hypothetical protein n=1 Tax=Dactylosporangium sp. CA-233914 TaxID=3239934 RepID=UPI003D8E5FF7
MTTDDQGSIPIRLATTMGTEQWNIRLPVNVVVQRLIARLVAAPELPFREQDDSGQRVPYRLMWKEGNRYLAEAETLARTGVSPNDTLVVTHQARAGRKPFARSAPGRDSA